jgi:hypothetical protein
VALHLSSDLRCLSLTVQDVASSRCALLTFDTAVLRQRRRELREIAAQYSNVTVLMDHCRECIVEMAARWKEGRDPLAAKLQALHEVILLLRRLRPLLIRNLWN